MLVVYMLFIYKRHWVAMSEVLCLLKLAHCAKRSLKHIHLGQVDITQWHKIFPLWSSKVIMSNWFSNEKWYRLPQYILYTSLRPRALAFEILIVNISLLETCDSFGLYLSFIETWDVSHLKYQVRMINLSYACLLLNYASLDL